MAAMNHSQLTYPNQVAYNIFNITNINQVIYTVTVSRGNEAMTIFFCFALCLLTFLASIIWTEKEIAREKLRWRRREQNATGGNDASTGRCSATPSEPRTGSGSSEGAATLFFVVRRRNTGTTDNQQILHQCRQIVIVFEEDLGAESQTENEGAGSRRPPNASEGATNNNSAASSSPRDHSSVTPTTLPHPESEPSVLPPQPEGDVPSPPPPEPASEHQTDGRLPSGGNSASENREHGHGVGLDAAVDSGTNGVTTSVGNNDGNDRWSFSSLRSGGEKLKVIELNAEALGCAVSSMMNPVMQNNFRNNDLIQQVMQLFSGSGNNAGEPLISALSAQAEEQQEQPVFQMELNEVN